MLSMRNICLEIFRLRQHFLPPIFSLISTSFLHNFSSLSSSFYVGVGMVAKYPPQLRLFQQSQTLNHLKCQSKPWTNIHREKRGGRTQRESMEKMGKNRVEIGEKVEKASP